MRPVALAFLAFLAGLGSGAAQDAPAANELAADLRGDARLTAIVTAFSTGYGKDFQGATRGARGEVVLHFRGREFLYDDGRKKSFAELLETPDIKDTFCQLYPLRNPTDKLPENFDPGRFRVEALFKTLYGASASEVSQNCVMVDFCGHKVKFNARCGAAGALDSVGKELSALFASRPDLKVYLDELGGTLEWRFIAGTQRLSNHSFGSAIDLNVKLSDYWRWDGGAGLASFSRKNWPIEIIEAFERHGFIWGGKWWHYDTMHFEYRPELIAFARAFSSEAATGPESELKSFNAPAGKSIEPLVPLTDSAR
jgi:hypothetical protein